MSTPLQGSPTRQAVASIAGIVYQIWQSVLSWISLEGSEVLYLEGAERPLGNERDARAPSY